VNENVDWLAPKYGIWNPDSLPGFITSLEQRRIPYCVISDQLLADRTPTAEWRGSNKPVYCWYANKIDHRARVRLITYFQPISQSS